MKTNHIFLAVLALVATGIAGFAVGKTTTQEAIPLVEPTKEHKWLASHAGEYAATMSGMMGTSPGTCKIENLLGGLWNVTHFETKMMGQPFNGMEILGYNPLEGKFVSVWVDSMSTMLMTMKGSFDEKTNTLTMSGMSYGMDGGQAQMTNTTTYHDKGMSYKMMMEGQDTPAITIEYVKKK